MCLKGRNVSECLRAGRADEHWAMNLKYMATKLAESAKASLTQQTYPGKGFRVMLSIVPLGVTERNDAAQITRSVGGWARARPGTGGKWGADHNSIARARGGLLGPISCRYIGSLSDDHFSHAGLQYTHMASLLVCSLTPQG